MILLEALCVFLICWIPPQSSAASNFNNASITVTGNVELTLNVDTTLKSQSGGKQLQLKKGDKVRIRRLTENGAEFFGDESRDYPGTLPLDSFAEADRINQLLAPSRNAEEIRRDEYLENCLIKTVIVTLDYLAIMGGLCLLASIKHDWMGFVVNVILIAVVLIFTLVFQEQIAALMF